MLECKTLERYKIICRGNSKLVFIAQTKPERINKLKISIFKKNH